MVKNEFELEPSSTEENATAFYDKLLHAPLAERMQIASEIYENPLDLKFSVDRVDKNPLPEVSWVYTSLGPFRDPLNLGKIDISDGDVKDLANLFVLGSNHVELSDGNAIQREHNSTFQKYEIYFVCTDNGGYVKSRVIQLQDLNGELEKIAEWSKFNKNAAWEKLKQYVMIPAKKGVELVPISSFFQESVYGYELDENSRKHVESLKEKYMKRGVTEDNVIEFYGELEETPEILKAYENSLRKKGKCVEDEFGLPPAKEKIDVDSLKTIAGVSIKVDEDNKEVKIMGSIDDCTLSLIEEETRGYTIGTKKSKLRKVGEFILFGGAISGFFFGSYNPTTAFSASSENTVAVYSNNIDWNNSEGYILSTAEKVGIGVERVDDPSKLSSYKVVLVLGGHEAYTDENMPTNIPKDYLDQEDKLKLKSSNDAKLIKVIKNPFGKSNQKMIIFAGNARDDTAKIPFENYEDPKPDSLNNISEVLLGTDIFNAEYELLLKVFFDYNGNGQYDPIAGELLLADVILQAGEINCRSNEDGSCKLYAPYGRSRIGLNAPKKFKYILPSTSEVAPIDVGLSIFLDKDTTKNVPLAEGFFTLPFEGEFKIDRMYDRDPAEGKILWWNGNNKCNPGDDLCDSETGTGQHHGIDYDMKIGENVLAAAPGVVSVIDERNKSIVIEHISVNGMPVYTIYGHLSRVLVKKGDKINRGELIGKSGITVTSYPHLHFALMSKPDSNSLWELFDPYKPIVPVPKGYWLYTWPVHTWEPEYHLFNNLNWWTVFNNPQNP